MGNNERTTRKGNENDGVEQLLRQTQDDILLKLTLNSHTTSSRPIIDPDLDRRFNALKINKRHPITHVDPTPQANTAGGNAHDDIIISDNDLFARFSALKYSTPIKNKSSGGTSQDSFVQKQLKLTEFEDDGDDDDEVEKLIKWAVDAARLDPSPPSDDDNDEDSDDDDGIKCKRK